MSAFVHLLSRLFTVEEINGGNLCPTYMYRWRLISTRWFKAYLHRFVEDDWSLDLHDHPKRFVTIGLRGSYIEQRTPRLAATGYTREEIYRAPWFRSFPATHIHRLRLPRDAQGRPIECWTVAIVGRPVRPWGFWHMGRFIPWRRYVHSEIAGERKACA
ncbi:MAG: hypothetical protein ABIT01_21100 [Thermoanaerobaculia bacterium]